VPTPDLTDLGESFALNLTIVEPEKLTYTTLLGFVRVYRKKAGGRFPDFIEFTEALYMRFLDELGGEGEDGDEFLGIKCLIEPERLESHNYVQQNQ